MYYYTHQALLVIGWVLMMVGIGTDFSHVAPWVKVVWAIATVCSIMGGLVMVKFSDYFHRRKQRSSS